MWRDVGQDSAAVVNCHVENGLTDALDMSSLTNWIWEKWICLRLGCSKCGVDDGSWIDLMDVLDIASLMDWIWAHDGLDRGKWIDLFAAGILCKTLKLSQRASA